MPEYMIAGIPVYFPFEPYDVQKAYMEKLITCYKDGTNGVLESPTGTGKTLSLLCASLAWVVSRKAEVKKEIIAAGAKGAVGAEGNQSAKELPSVGPKASSWGVPKIIYASRTHSQLSQAMQELKRTAYAFMRAVVLGSRDQLCIHPEVMREQSNSNKIQMCKMHVEAKRCSFHMRVESKKDHPDFRGPTVMDIEDLVKVGRQLKMCPYFSSKELVEDADITFMPYNYILDPKARKANKIDLNNTIVILDEAHNIEKICEESASVQIKSSDIAMVIEDVTHIMNAINGTDKADYSAEEPQDFTMNDLELLKIMLLDLEKEIDAIVVENKIEGKTLPASFMFEILDKCNFSMKTVNTVTNLLDKLLQFLAVQNQNTAFRKGGSFQILSDLLNVVFVQKDEAMDRVYKSFKVHVQVEEPTQYHSRGGAQKEGWLSKATAAAERNAKVGKILNYWCFNPGFGMEQLLNTRVRSIILTSGTLAPLTPLIAELAIPVAQRLENPHIVGSSQVFVKIIGSGPDREQLISNYANRDNPKYISSLGQTILNVSRIVPDGLLVFFPSYPLLNQCVNAWHASGLWSDISRHKPIFVEPRDKESFNNTMEEFYESIRASKGACFMAVCRGKVSEGLDFADRNGRAVIITGLPFPPLKDPKVILKKRYLEDNRTPQNELLSGQAWYALDATRAVNQAIGRVIRHSNDYGAILLCDSRFQHSSQVQQLSKWVRQYLGNAPKSTTFGPVIKELRDFFKNAEKLAPKSQMRSLENLQECENLTMTIKEEKSVDDFADARKILSAKRAEVQTKLKMDNTNSNNSVWSPMDYANASQSLRKKTTGLDFMSRLNDAASAINFNSCESVESSSQVNIYKRDRASPTDTATATNSCANTSTIETFKKKKFKLVANSPVKLTNISETSSINNEIEIDSLGDRREFLKVVRSVLSPEQYSTFCTALISYKSDDNFDALMAVLLQYFNVPKLHYMLKSMRRFIRMNDRGKYDEIIANLK